MVIDEDRRDSLNDEPTHLDEAVPVGEAEGETAAFKSAEFLAGREVGVDEGYKDGFDAGFKDGVERAVATLRAELLRARATEDEIRHIVARVRAGSAK
jgi:hypothetical protein